MCYDLYTVINTNMKGWLYMNGSQVIKQLMLESNININKLAELLEIKPQSVRNKLSRNSFTLAEFEKVISLLNAELQVVSKTTKNIYH